MPSSAASLLQRRGSDSVLAAVLGQLDGLCSATSLPASIRRRARALVIHLAGDALAQPSAERFRGLSRINVNGLPFQWSVCLDDGVPGVRFLCECGVPGSDPAQRCTTTLERFASACALTGGQLPNWPVKEIVACALPDELAFPRAWGSAIWLAGGAGPKGLGLKIYLCLEHGDAYQRWWRFGRLLQILGREVALERLCELSAKVSRGSWPVAVGIDALPDGTPGRLKLYFRNDDVSRHWLSTWYRSVGADEHLEAVDALLTCTGIANRVRHPARTFFVSAEFGPGADAVSLKTDVAICRWMKDDARVAARVVTLAARLGLSAGPYLSALEAIGAGPRGTSGPGATHQLIGVGFEPTGSRHVNVYCKPPLPAGRTGASRQPMLESS